MKWQIKSGQKLQFSDRMKNKDPTLFNKVNYLKAINDIKSNDEMDCEEFEIFFKNGERKHTEYWLWRIKSESITTHLPGWF